MPLRLDAKKKLQTNSDRVKCVYFHQSEPWILSSLYNGTVTVFDYETQNIVKSIEVSEHPIRCAIFISRKQWIVTCGDDLMVRVYNYNTMNKLTSFEAHNDFIRHATAHPKLPLLLTCSDDLTIKLWDWDRDWLKVQTYQNHSHYVMMVQWSPKDSHVFASASLDRTIRIWGIPSNVGTISNSTVTVPNYTLLGHDSGINCLAYSLSAEKPYIATCSDDKTVRVWDYQTKQCIQVLSGHSKAVRSVVYHPQLPLILSCSEDCTIKIWHATTYRLECTLNYMMDRSWCLAVCNNMVAIGFDEGTMVIKIGSEQPLATLNSGKIILAKGNEICQANLRVISTALGTLDSNSCEWGFDYEDGERIILPTKELGCSEIYPQDIQYHPNGRFISICGDGEFIIYTTQALRNKCFGKAIELVWSLDGHYFATRENGDRIVLYNNFKEFFSFNPNYFVNEIFGGQLLGVKSSDFVCFYNWSECKLIRRIDVSSTLNNIYWDDLGNYLCLSCIDTFYILKYDKDNIEGILSNPSVNSSIDTSEGIETSFELISEIQDKIESGIWVSTCFLYITSQLRLQIWMNGYIDIIAYLSEKNIYHILGYVKELQRVVLMDREFNCISYSLNLNYIEYQACIVRKDLHTAEDLYWNKIPSYLHTKIAKFLEIQGYKEKALEVTTDFDQKFDLALNLGKLELCITILQQIEAKEKGEREDIQDIQNNKVATSLNKQRWKILGDIALEQGKFSLSIACYKEVSDLNSLLLIYSSIGDKNGLEYVAELAKEEQQWNVAFVCHVLLNDSQGCINDLISAKMVPHAALFARTYKPSKINDIVELWNKQSFRPNEKLASPLEASELFLHYNMCLDIEANITKYIEAPVKSWIKMKEILDSDIIEDYMQRGPNYIINSIWGDQDISIKSDIDNDKNCPDESKEDIEDKSVEESLVESTKDICEENLQLTTESKESKGSHKEKQKS
ncbi:coatomer protein complex beta subunit protein, putative [Cryptosporidium muris RN66]|uniref:Coatomer subunit beta' n=1 Tax=Cryptosporidium muris (strain RN66) TaxID=441375 RepID=B6ACA1_CRYMR|nr:coatomer protein complex beta subunit protein, putative [Cryptosporidium muris RN66]EEA06157.1 coatomer protein complex beta subunit protein, putative [Cryptosporidium muris RN66]|eukprot:XP_002140506.1 coatomer protein complex beta subunit protein [Cryptosporidium muris RN66]